jgi:hypothetical protein
MAASVNTTGVITRIYPGGKDNTGKDVIYLTLSGEGPRPISYFVLRKTPANGDFWFSSTFSLLLAAFVNRMKVSVATVPFNNSTPFVDIIYAYCDRPA